MAPFLLIGLGNPGKDYAGNRHNIGFMAVDAIAEAHRFSAWSKKFRGLIAEGSIDGHKTFLLKPQTYMNLSGESAAEMARFYKIPLEHIFVIHDELDLPLAKIRVKKGGGNGGHNGLKSLDAHIGADYWRMRVGIGRPQYSFLPPSELIADYVLSDFDKAEKKIVKNLTLEIAKHIGLLLKGDDAGFMNKISLAMKEE